MLSCKEMAEILSSGRELGWVKRAQFKMHLMMCTHCSRYAAHLRMMRDSFKKLFAGLTRVEKSEIEGLENQVIEKVVKEQMK